MIEKGRYPNILLSIAVLTVCNLSRTGYPTDIHD